jgi:hypothetical protein
LLLPSRRPVARREVVLIADGEGSGRLTAVATRLAQSLGLTAFRIDLAARPDVEAVRFRINQSWLTIASLDQLGDRQSAESVILGERLRAPLLLLRTVSPGEP